ncbi:hypothetical protein OS493_021405 [Desmophyllum pertusum]|uniref:ABC transmembrane type-1 domain-containing protein n=1 Tax=Desmophyllum pertusum TaxID=174260 RepID=A0A9W9Z2F5_9CNID|nr:hypothetical protein OS493_021405 [Desmophyllum pertusum]
MDAEYDRLESELRRKSNPKRNANIFSILSFWWVGELLAIGNKRPLENDDLFYLLDEDKTQTSTEKLQRTWNEETTSFASNKRKNGHRLLNAIIRAFPYTDYMVIVSTALLAGVCNVLQPVFLSLLLSELMKSSDEEFWWAYIYAAGICLSSFVRAIATHQWNYHAYLMALRWKSATIGIVYKKMEEPSIDRLVNEGNLEEEFKRLEIAEEDRVIGYISWKLYWHYMRAGMRCILAVAVITLLLIVQGSLILPDWWLLHLTSRSHDQQHQIEDLYIYGGLVGGAVSLSIIRAAVFLNALINSSKHLHNSMLSEILKATVLFFDTNPIGRILNRFSRDIGIVDELLPDVFLEAVQIVLFCVGAVVLPSILNPWIILPATPLMMIFIVIGRYFLKTSRDLRRLEGVNRSPVLSHFSDTLMGLVTIRAYKREDAFLKALYRYQDDHNQIWFSILSTTRWLGVRLDMICVSFVTSVVFLAIATQSGSGKSR